MQPAHRGREEDQVPHGRDRARQDRRGKRRGAAGDVLAAAGRRARRRHARQRHRVRPPHAPARRAGHGHVLRRPVLQPAAGKQREQERHDPPVSAQTQRNPDGHGRGTAGDRRRGRQPPHARAGLPDARRGIRRRTARMATNRGVAPLNRHRGVIMIVCNML